MGIISDTHEETDGPIYSNTTLFTQTDTQEAYSGVQTYDITVTAPDASRYTLSGTDRLGSVSGDNQPVTISVGDTINFNSSNVSASHPFRIRVSSGGADVSTPAATGQGSTGITQYLGHQIQQVHLFINASLTVECLVPSLSIQ